MTTGHNDDSEPLFPTERFRKRMSRATKKPFSADAPLHISQNRFATTNAPEPVPLASSRTAPSLNYARGWHARVCVVVARQRQRLRQPPSPPPPPRRSPPPRRRRPRRLVPTTGAPPSWCVARRLRRRRLCFARRLRRRARNVACVDGLHASRLRRITRGRPRGCHRISRRPG